MKQNLYKRIFIAALIVLAAVLINKDTFAGSHKVSARIVVVWNQGFVGGHFNVKVQIKSDTAFRLGNFKLRLVYDSSALTFIKDTTLGHYCCSYNNYSQSKGVKYYDTITVNGYYAGLAGSGTMVDTSYSDSSDIHQFNFIINALGDSTGLKLVIGTAFLEDDNSTPVGTNPFKPLNQENNGVVLPISLINFSATPEKNDKVQLNWTTATEENTSYFNIERSADAVNFSDIGKIAAKGNSVTLQNYQYIDLLNPENNNTGTTYYRLKEMDVNGNSTYSQINAVNFSGSLASLTFYPNPATTDLTLSQPAEGTLAIYNTIGQQVIKLNIDQSNQSISLKDLQVGLYLLQFTRLTGETQTFRFVKQ
jgi:hypothetical protein